MVTGDFLRFLAAFFLVSGSAAGQFPRAVPRDGGPMLSADTLTYSYAAPGILFSQSMGAAQVVASPSHGAGFVNPALLGEPKARWSGGQATWRYSGLFPELNLPDLRNIHQQVIHQGLGMGLSLQWTSHHLGAIRMDTASASEPIGFSGNTFALSAGTPVGGTERAAHYVGGTAAWITAPAVFADRGPGDQGFLLDLGYLGVFAETFRAGISVQNLGLPVQGLRPLFVRERYRAGVLAYRQMSEEEDYLLTPPRIHGGAGWGHAWNGSDLRILETTLSAAYTLEFRREGFGEPRGFQSYESDWLLLNTVHTGYGVLVQAEGPIFKWGFGLDLFNHLLLQFTQLDSSVFGWDSQRSFLLSLHHLLDWKKSDWTWWRLKPDRPATRAD